MFDGLLMAAVAAEFRQNLLGARVDKIYQPARLEVVMTMRQPGKNIMVLVSSDPEAARVHITEVARENPYVPPPFCMLLRKYLVSSRVIRVEQVGLDRILRITFSRSKEETPKTLVIEVMGRHSNMALVDEGSNMILDSIKHIGSDVSRVRHMGPGIEYALPPAQNKLNIMSVSGDDLDTALYKFKESMPSASCSRFIVSRLEGFGRESAARVLREAGLRADEPCADLSRAEVAKLRDVLLRLADSIRNESFLSCPSQLLDSAYSRKEHEDATSGQRTELLNVVDANITRCRRKLEAQNNEISQAKKDLECRKLGELILANAPEISPGANTAMIVDYFDPAGGHIEVRLDPRLSPYENAERNFERYARAKRVLENASNQIDITRAELEYLEQVATTINQADKLRDIEAIRAELIEQGYLKEAACNRAKKKSQKTTSERAPLSFTVEGYTVLVGRNNKENDFVTMKIADSDDLWMHARGIPGAHVVVKTGLVKGEVSERAIMAAAGIAAYFSKGRVSRKVAVDYTLRRHVRKPKGARPGMVIYSHQKTIMAHPVLPDSRITQ